MRALVVLGVVVACAPAAVAATGAQPAAHALVVGSNAGGAGQEALQYAEEDARRIAELLPELAGYDPGHVRVLLRPRAEELHRALDDLGEVLRRDAAAGRQSTAFFYYSGHARANALNLGKEEVPLPQLRDRLTSLPSTLTVVVLDACQSGAFSRIKGAEPTADFSFNSLASLRTSGIAVMASSSGSELSQESTRLRSSYFTHHLLVGLRGAGDTDRDGRVTLAEAYHHAYNATLVATAATAVGTQHASLEVDLKGKGDVPLSYPAQARARLELPAGLRGDVLVQTLPAGTVIAELHKSEGGAVTLAVAAGRYRALLRDGSGARQCELEIAPGRTTVLRDAGCVPVDLSTETVKGRRRVVRPWSIEVGAGFGQSRDDAYVDRLGDFGYESDLYIPLPRLSLAVGYRWKEWLSAVGEVTRLDERTFSRSSPPTTQSFELSTLGMTLQARIGRRLAAARGAPAVEPYAQAGLGVATAHTSLTRHDENTDVMSASRDRSWSVLLGAAAGLDIMPWRHFGLWTRLAWYRAPVLENRLGDVHDSGGLWWGLGVKGEL